MTDQTETESASASEYAELLAKLDFNARAYETSFDADAAAAIRALKAKVRDDEKTMRNMVSRWETTIADRDRLDLECARLTMDRDRLAGEVERLTKHISRLEHANDTAFAEVARLSAELATARKLVSAILTAVPFHHGHTELERRAREFLAACGTEGAR